SANWNVAQSVTVTGLDDQQVHGDQTYQINGTAASTDAKYSGLTMPPVSVVNTEADTAGFTISSTAIQTSMAGASATFSVALTSIPTGPVVLNLTSTNFLEGLIT